jgi:hypothetical protein
MSDQRQKTFLDRLMYAGSSAHGLIWGSGVLYFGLKTMDVLGTMFLIPLGLILVWDATGRLARAIVP